MIDIAPYRKTIVAIIGGLTVTLSTVTEVIQDGELNVGDVATIITSALIAFGVYQAPNTPKGTSHAGVPVATEEIEYFMEDD